MFPPHLRAATVVAAIACIGTARAMATGADSPGGPLITIVPVPAWAFPGAGPATPAPTPTALASSVTLPGSSAHFTLAQTRAPFAPPDWQPERHPPMPEIVAHGHRPAVAACGYCHLPDGSGRPENARLKGLPAAYIEQQVAAFRDGSRGSAAGESYSPAEAMRRIAIAASPAEISAAAAYFSAMQPAAKTTVREVADLPPPHQEHFIYGWTRTAPPEPIAGRIIEGVEQMDRHELRDPAMGYTAFVPRDSISRGRQLATGGPDGPATACFICHGPQLTGTPVAPPIAGNFATYLFRQLLGFRNGTRADPLSIAMRPVVAKLSEGDMVDLAAFVASQSP